MPYSVWWQKIIKKHLQAHEITCKKGRFEKFLTWIEWHAKEMHILSAHRMHFHIHRTDDSFSSLFYSLVVYHFQFRLLQTLLVRWFFFFLFTIFCLHFASIYNMCTVDSFDSFWSGLEILAVRSTNGYFVKLKSLLVHIHLCCFCLVDFGKISHFVAYLR